MAGFYLLCCKKQESDSAMVCRFSQGKQTTVYQDLWAVHQRNSKGRESSSKLIYCPLSEVLGVEGIDIPFLYLKNFNTLKHLYRHYFKDSALIPEKIDQFVAFVQGLNENADKDTTQAIRNSFSKTKKLEKSVALTYKEIVSGTHKGYNTDSYYGNYIIISGGCIKFGYSNDPLSRMDSYFTCLPKIDFLAFILLPIDEQIGTTLDQLVLQKYRNQRMKKFNGGKSEWLAMDVKDMTAVICSYVKEAKLEAESIDKLKNIFVFCAPKLALLMEEQQKEEASTGNKEGSETKKARPKLKTKKAKAGETAEI